MATKPKAAKGKSKAVPKSKVAVKGENDDIGEETRLALWRSLLEIRHVEQRAYDLFLQNLIKGTSHLALGHEAVAAGFAAGETIVPTAGPGATTVPTAGPGATIVPTAGPAAGTAPADTTTAGAFAGV